MSNKVGQHRADGFTLLETLIAFTILTVALVVLLRAFGSGLTSVDSSEAHMVAALHAASKLDEVGPLIALQEGRHVGAFDDGMVWIVEIAPAPPELTIGEDLPVVPFEVVVTITWDSRQSYVLRTMRLGARS